MNTQLTANNIKYYVKDKGPLFYKVISEGRVLKCLKIENTESTKMSGNFTLNFGSLKYQDFDMLRPRKIGQSVKIMARVVFSNLKYLISVTLD